MVPELHSMACMVDIGVRKKRSTESTSAEIGTSVSRMPSAVLIWPETLCADVGYASLLALLIVVML